MSAIRFDLSSSWNSTALHFYDDIRLLPPSANAKVKTQRERSSVISVELPDGTASGSAIQDASLQRLCHVTSMLPLSDGEGNLQSQYGLYSAGAGFLAVRDFNARNGAIVADLISNDRLRECNMRLSMDSMDTEFSPIYANRGLIDALSRNHSLSSPKPCAVVGAYRSAVSAPLAITSAVHNVPIVSSGSTSSQLDNKDIYRYFGRTVPSDAGVAKAAVTYLRDILQVTHVGILYVRDAFGSEFNRDFSRAAFALKPPMSVVSSSYDLESDHEVSIQNAVSVLKESGYNYFFGVLSSPTYNVVMRTLRAKGLLGPGRFWLLGEDSGMLLSGGLRYDADEENEVAQAAHGMAVMSMNVEDNDAFDEAWRSLESTPSLKQYFVSKQPETIDLSMFQFSHTTTLWERLHYDAIMALGIAACEIEDDFFSGPSLFDALRKISFTGASGLVSFDRETATRDFSQMSYKVMNVVTSEPNEKNEIELVTTPVAEQIASNSANSSSMIWVRNHEMTFPDGSKTPPAILPPKAENTNLINKGVLVAGLTLAAIVMLLSLVFSAWTIVYRKSKVVTSSQPGFLVMLCVGTFMMACSIVPLCFQDPLSRRGLNIACMAFPWLFSLGFVVAFSGLFSKTARVNKTLAAISQFHRIRVETKPILIPFLVLFSCNVILLIMWTVLSPLRWQRTAVASYDHYGRSIESFGHCVADNNKHTWPFVSLIIAIDASCLLFAIRENYLARKVPSEYSETYYVTISMVSILQASVIGVPVLVLVVENPTARFITLAILVAILCVAVLIPLFIPKILARRREQQESSSRKLSSRKAKLRKELEIWTDLEHQLRSQEANAQRPRRNSFDSPRASKESDSSGDESSRSTNACNTPWAEGFDNLFLESQQSNSADGISADEDPSIDASVDCGGLNNPWVESVDNLVLN